MIPTPLRRPAVVQQHIKGLEKLSDRIKPIAQRLGLGMPSACKMITRGDGNYPFQVWISELHTIDPHHLKFLSKLEHGLTEKYISFYADKPLPPLLLYCHINAGDSSKAIVRTRARGRLRRAFSVALANNGYDWEGNGVSRSLGTKGAQLYGTVRLMGYMPRKMMLIDFRKLVRHFKVMIEDTIAPALKKEGARKEEFDKKESTEPPEEAPSSDPK